MKRFLLATAALVALAISGLAFGQSNSNGLPCEYSGSVVRKADGSVLRYASDELKVLLSLMPAEYGNVSILNLTLRAIRRPELVDGIPILRKGRQVEITVAGSAAYQFVVALDEYLQRTTDAGTYTVTLANVFGTKADGTLDSNSGWNYEMPSVGKAPKKLAPEVKA